MTRMPGWGSRSSGKTHPQHIQGSLLIDVIEKGPVPRRYFLSPRAARGMLRRAGRMTRHLFPPLRRALEILASGDQGEGDNAEM
jgi:DNA (cytosine-5)-methyltransferase 1